MQGRDKDKESNNPGGIKGVTKEFMVCLARAVKDTQAEKKHCYHCSSTEHFIHNCPLIKTLRENTQLNGKEGTASKKGAQRPLTMVSTHKEPPDGGSQGIKPPQQNPFMNPDPFKLWHGVKNIARVRINGESCMVL